MAHGHVDLSHEITRLKPANKTLGLGLMAVGVAGIIAAFFASGGDHRRFWFAYLFGLAAAMAISAASLIFVMVNHLVRAGWITNVRRILEAMALQLVLVLILTLPLVVLGLMKPTVTVNVPQEDGSTKPETQALVYSWDRASNTPLAPEVKNPSQLESTTAKYPNEQVQPGASRAFNEVIAEKTHSWLMPWFWAARVTIMLIAMAAMAWWYYSQSVKQDLTGDIDISARLSEVAGPLVVAAGLIVTFLGFDLYMSLDPMWVSTMYGIYYFASGTLAMWSFLALAILVLQNRGYLKQSVGVEHRHDIGKFQWAFIFFWTYAGFGQYMLQWYANLPEETFWYDKRGYTTAHATGYSPIVLALLFGRFVLPFLGLVSRHAKRNRFGQAFWSVWLLAFFFVDMYLLVIPEESYSPLFAAPEILAAGGIAVLWLGSFLRTLASAELRPIADPRVHESLASANLV